MTDSAAPADADDYEDQPEEDNQGAAFLDLAVGTLAGAVTGGVGYAIGGADGAVIGGGATPFVTAIFGKLVGPWWADRLRRQEKMLETAADAGRLTREELADRAAESEESRFLTGKAVNAATNTIWPEGIRAIGRAYAAGLLAKDKPTLDIRLRVLGIMQDLDEMHVRLLDLLVKSEPEQAYGVSCRAVPQSVPSYVSGHWGEPRAGEPVFWSKGNRIWTTSQITDAMPHLQPVLASLLGELQQSGLIQENDTAPAMVKRLGDELVEKVNQQAERMEGGNFTPQVRIDQTTLQAVEAGWSPTELGEKILGFYAEAGAED